MKKNEISAVFIGRLFVFSALILMGSNLIAQGWTSVEPLPNGFQSDHSYGFALNDTGYLVAGQTDSGYSDAFYSYDPTSDTWTTLEDFPGSARGYAIGDDWDGKAWFGFGNSSAGTMNDLWVFDPATGIWEEKASCPCAARMHPAFIAIDDHIYVGLGNSSAGDLNDWWVYDMATDTWSEKPDFPDTQRHHPYQFGIDGQVYVGFGHHGGEIFNDLYRYDPSSETWTEMATLPSQGRVAGAQFSHDGKGYALSGDGEGHTSMASGEFWQYDPLNDTWASWPDHPGMSRWAPSSFVLNNEVYLINGMSMDPGSFDYMGTNWKLPMTPTLSLDMGLSAYLGETVMCGSNPLDVTVSITNWGSDTLTNAQLELVVDASVVLTHDWEGSLEAYQSEVVEMGPYNFEGATAVSVQLVAEDSNPLNDVVSASVTTAPDATTHWQINLDTDDWGQETSWEIRNESGALVDQSGPNAYASQTFYEIQVYLPATGCFTFTLMDSYGDGIYGSCTIESMDAENQSMAVIFDYDGSFVFSELSQLIHVSTVVGVNDVIWSDLTVAYPNPFSDFLYVKNVNFSGNEPISLQVFNVLGQLIHEQQVTDIGSNASGTIDSQTWKAGVYTIRVQQGSHARTIRAVKK